MMSSRNIPPKIDIEGQDKGAKLAQEFHIMHTPNEFLVSIIEVIPQMEYKLPDNVEKIGYPNNVAKLQTSGILQKIIGRYGMSPAAFKKFVNVAKRNLDQYEKKFGEIVITPPEGLQ